MPWYLFNPVDPFPHNTVDPNNYNLVGLIPPTCPSPNLRLCSIQAADNLGKPNFALSPNLPAEIANALNNRVDTTNVLLRPTLYP